MKLQRKGTRHSHRGVIGVESAIVMIAFVIVAAALAFVVLNMGFSTTQKTKQAIVSSTDEASSALEIAGKIIGSGHITAGKLNATAVPIKIVSGGASINLNPQNAAIRYLSNNVEHGNIYVGALPTGVYDTLSDAMDGAISAGYISANPVNGGGPNSTSAVFYFNVNRNNNFILDQGEHGMMAIAFEASERPQSLDVIRAEIILPTGAPLTVERTVPNISSIVVDLG
ncbi:archaellin/type IV pilin N-terminal domain-containing protein [Candidatus Nitrosarchaeum limnium]|jgi:flagellin FlaB|uniref:Flagellin n=1 Tax=Candidatus Nitrosarchaeum limnium BG20 TaxID=859192 RepID=S2EVP6_9ARCH|nr:archaellin/type IV pilin N-terminal domain-containing protein [Candidatus Nitrosarchaeum limnium]EPA06334.1 archaeal flagellin N-terminal-like domain protein [Candidatus Nitrosarchaeum limnium BG20]